MSFEKIKVQASPNIALIKYWGKLETDPKNDFDRNLATNPSLSMTLSRALTEVEIFPTTKPNSIEFLVQNKPPTENDKLKIEKHLNRVFDFFKTDLSPFVEKGFAIHSTNNFPMGTGMASSASAFAAMTLGFTALALGKDKAQIMLSSGVQDLSQLARRGSGSACRSLEGPWVFWEGPSARKLPLEWKLFDTLLIVSKEHKKIPSSLGHVAATTSPLFSKRQLALPLRSQKILEALESQSLATLGPLIEQEALELHAVARSGNPSADYLITDTLKFLEALGPPERRDFFFTLDAGPNIHFLSVRPIQNELKKIAINLGLKNFEIWEDYAGHGPKLF